MSKDEFKDLVVECGEFLGFVNKVIPGRVDDELISFLGGMAAHPFNLDLLYNSIENAKKTVTSPSRR